MPPAFAASSGCQPTTEAAAGTDHRQWAGAPEDLGEGAPLGWRRSAGRVILEREHDVLSEFVGALTGAYSDAGLDVLRNEWD